MSLCEEWLYIVVHMIYAELFAIFLVAARTSASDLEALLMRLGAIELWVGDRRENFDERSKNSPRIVTRLSGCESYAKV